MPIPQNWVIYFLVIPKGKFIVRFNGLELLALNYGLRHATLSVLGGLCLE
jgi:uncharacterized membrane protein